MNLSVNDKNLLKVVQDMRDLMWEVLLPRIVDLELEIHTLRKHVWPWVQSQKEVVPMDRMKEKRDFFRNLKDDDIRILLSLKSKCHKANGLPSSINKELEDILKARPT